MECPVCQQQFSSSLKFDQHMDSTHSESPMNNLSAFFGKIFQPNIMINDILPTSFELNENSADLMPSGLTDADFDRFMALRSKNKRVYNLSEFIRKDHWESNGIENCGILDCGKQLGLINGRQNCYKCGKQVCMDHSKFQMKLAGDCKHDPINGIWARVCIRCYCSRDGYDDNRGVVRIRTGKFIKSRAVKVAQALMESNKIELRLNRVVERMRCAKNSGILARFVPNEPSVVDWVPDNQGISCSICASHFTFLFRRHHCRLCGIVICSNCLIHLVVLNDDTLKICKTCDYLLTLYD